jgi:hypothetical protein
MSPSGNRPRGFLAVGTRAGLTTAREIKGLGTAGASGLLALMSLVIRPPDEETTQSSFPAPNSGQKKFNSRPVA